MPTRSFRWLVLLACLSVAALVSTTVFLAATSDESSVFTADFDDDDVDDEDFDEDDFEDEFDEDEAFEYGDDEALDFLFDECDEGDLTACDDLYYESPEGSDYEAFGSTCGGREDDLYGECESELEEEEDVDLDALHEECAAGDMDACDELYFESPVGSDEEEFGSTCGGRQDETNGDCA